MLICPYCKNELQQVPTNNFCPVCNSFLGDIEINSLQNHFIQNAGLTEETMYYADVSGEEMIGNNYFEVLKLCYNEDEIDYARQVEYNNRPIKFNMKHVLSFLSLFSKRMYIEATISLLIFIAVLIIFNVNTIVGFILFVLYVLGSCLITDFLIYNHIKVLLKKLKMNKKHLYQIPQKEIIFLQKKLEPNNTINIMFAMLIIGFIFYLFSITSVNIFLHF